MLWGSPPMLAEFQALASPVGLLEVKRLPLTSTAAQKEGLVPVQETLVRRPVWPSMLTTLQALAPPVGLLEASTSPWPSVATQIIVVVHDTLPSCVPRGGLLLVVSMAVVTQALAPPTGLVEVSTLPSVSTAAQNEALGQEMAFRRVVPSMFAAVQALAPPVGSVEVRTLPLLSTAAQKASLGQETPLR